MRVRKFPPMEPEPPNAADYMSQFAKGALLVMCGVVAIQTIALITMWIAK